MDQSIKVPGKYFFQFKEGVRIRRKNYIICLQCELNQASTKCAVLWCGKCCSSQRDFFCSKHYVRPAFKFSTELEMFPPWVEFPLYVIGDTSYNMKEGADYISKFRQKYESLSGNDQRWYQLDFPEPLSWRHFYDLYYDYSISSSSDDSKSCDVHIQGSRINEMRSDAIYTLNYPHEILNIIFEYIIDFSAISAGMNHSIVLKDDGTLHSWGGDVYRVVSNTPKGSGFTAVSTGGLHSIALKDDGTLHSWGCNEYLAISNTPKGTGFIAISAGIGYHSIALRNDGTLHSWGRNSFGQLSDTPKGNGFIAVSAGSSHSIALKGDGTLYSWGSDECNQISDTPKGSGFIAVSAGNRCSTALKDDGTLISWGSDSHEQVLNTPKGSGFIAVSVGRYHSIALRKDGTLISWGSDIFKQISNIPKGSGFIEISAGELHSIALKEDGTLHSWGNNEYKQISDAPLTI